MNQTSLACKEFLNKSVENICDRHKMERKLMRLDKFKQKRQNCQGDRVDINELKRMQKLDDRQLGAFGGNK